MSSNPPLEHRQFRVHSQPLPPPSFLMHSSDGGGFVSSGPGDRPSLSSAAPSTSSALSSSVMPDAMSTGRDSLASANSSSTATPRSSTSRPERAGSISLHRHSKSLSHPYHRPSASIDFSSLAFLAAVNQPDSTPSSPPMVPHPGLPVPPLSASLASVAPVVAVEAKVKKRFSKEESDRRQQRVPLWDVVRGKKLSGFASPMEKNLKRYLAEHPNCIVYDKYVAKQLQAAQQPIPATVVERGAAILHGGAVAMPSRHYHSRHASATTFPSNLSHLPDAASVASPRSNSQASSSLAPPRARPGHHHSASMGNFNFDQRSIGLGVSSALSPTSEGPSIDSAASLPPAPIAFPDSSPADSSSMSFPISSDDQSNLPVVKVEAAHEVSQVSLAVSVKAAQSRRSSAIAAQRRSLIMATTSVPPFSTAALVPASASGSGSGATLAVAIPAPSAIPATTIRSPDSSSNSIASDASRRRSVKMEDSVQTSSSFTINRHSVVNRQVVQSPTEVPMMSPTPSSPFNRASIIENPDYHIATAGVASSLPYGLDFDVSGSVDYSSMMNYIGDSHSSAHQQHQQTLQHLEMSFQSHGNSASPVESAAVASASGSPSGALAPMNISRRNSRLNFAHSFAPHHLQSQSQHSHSHLSSAFLNPQSHSADHSMAGMTNSLYQYENQYSAPNANSNSASSVPPAMANFPSSDPPDFQSEEFGMLTGPVVNRKLSISVKRGSINSASQSLAQANSAYFNHNQSSSSGFNPAVDHQAASDSVMGTAGGWAPSQASSNTGNLRLPLPHEVYSNSLSRSRNSSRHHSLIVTGTSSSPAPAQPWFDTHSIDQRLKSGSNASSRISKSSSSSHSKASSRRVSQIMANQSSNLTGLLVPSFNTDFGSLAHQSAFQEAEEDQFSATLLQPFSQSPLLSHTEYPPYSSSSGFNDSSAPFFSLDDQDRF